MAGLMDTRRTVCCATASPGGAAVARLALITVVCLAARQLAAPSHHVVRPQRLKPRWPASLSRGVADSLSRGGSVEIQGPPAVVRSTRLRSPPVGLSRADAHRGRRRRVTSCPVSRSVVTPTISTSTIDPVTTAATRGRRRAQPGTPRVIPISTNPLADSNPVMARDVTATAVECVAGSRVALGRTG